MQASKLLAASGGVEKQYIDSLFSAYTYTGNNSTQTITNGIDLAGKGGMVWFKSRVAAANSLVFDTTRGVLNYLQTPLTNAQAASGAGERLTAFNSNGFSLGTDPGSAINASAATYVSWTFRNADKFYNHTTVTKTAGSNATVSFSNLTTLGMVRVKRTDSTGSWYIWHRSLSAGKLLIGETTAAEATLGHITVSGTTVTLVNGTIADGTYLVEGFAHDTGTDGLIQCGSYVGNGSATGPTITLGFEPQFLLVKATAATADPGTNNWFMADVAREMSMTNTVYLLSNANNPEDTGNNLFNPTATGFKISSAAQGINNSGTTYVYLAIRRPNKPPTTGTQVYNAIARTGTGAAATVTGVGFAPDAFITSTRNAVDDHAMLDRLRGGANALRTATAGAEYTAAGVTFGMDGFSVGTWGTINDTQTKVNHFFKRAPGVLSQICYSGTGANKTESHDLGVAPELWLVKGRSGATQWVWGSSLLANTEKIVMPTPAGKVTDATAWNSTYPTSTVLSLGTAAAVNTSAATYTAYLWATKAGVSKVFSYTGNGSSQNIDCGFTTGARFILIVRTSASGSVYIWDTVRGVVAGNDPHLALDTTAAEVTTDDSIDPLASGFSVNQVAATNINVTGATYIGIAYS